jgi:hypothetical protein
VRYILALSAILVVSGCNSIRPAEYLALQIAVPLTVAIIDQAVVPLAGKIRKIWFSAPDVDDDAAVADKAVYCNHPGDAPMYMVQLGACLPGDNEVTKTAYEIRDGSI